MIANINDKNYTSDVTNAGIPVLLEFISDRCGPCRMMKRILSEASDERKDIMFCRVDVEASPCLTERFGVMSTPTFVLIDGERILAGAVGARPRAAIDAMIDGALKTSHYVDT